MSEPGEIDHASRTDIPICIAVFSLSVATTAVGLRIYTRKVLINQLGLDDYCAIAALCLIFACDFAVTYNTNYGFGRHIWDVDPDLVPKYLRTLYVSILFYNASLMAIKMTFLSQYYRIFQHASNRVRWVFKGATIFVGCWAISQLLIAIFTCHPFSGYWDPKPGDVCIPNHPFWEINAAGNIVTDIMILLLPIPLIDRLRLPHRQKYILLGIFSLGLFTVCISLIRIRFLQQYADFTWENVESSGWSMGEIACGLTCACLPTMRPLLVHYAPWISSTAAGKSLATTFSGGGVTTTRDVEHGDFSSDASPAVASAAVPMTLTPARPVLIRGPSELRGDESLVLSPGSSGVNGSTWPLSAMSSTSGLFPRGLQSTSPLVSPPTNRADSGGENSDGVVGLYATRAALANEETDPPVQGPGSRRPSLDRRASSFRRPSLAGSSRRQSRESVTWSQPEVAADMRVSTPMMVRSSSTRTNSSARG